MPKLPVPQRMRSLVLDDLKIEIKVDLPERGIDGQDLAEFIVSALESWGGQRHPDDNLFHSVSVKSVKIGRITYNNPDPKEFR